LKKPTGSIQFWFYKPETEKTEPNPEKNRKKPSQNEKTEPNQFEPVFVQKNEPNWTETSRFEPVLSYFLKKFSLIIFFNKNQTEQKMITLAKS